MKDIYITLFATCLVIFLGVYKDQIFKEDKKAWKQIVLQSHENNPKLGLDKVFSEFF